MIGLAYDDLLLSGCDSIAEMIITTCAAAPLAVLENDRKPVEIVCVSVDGLWN